MIKYKASDLYLTVGQPPSYRINGTIKPGNNKQLTAEQTKKIAQSILDKDAFEEFTSKKEANFALHFANMGRFRVNVFQQRGHIGMVIRNIEDQIPNPEDLNLPNIVKEVTLKKSGLVLAVGATGSGKSTSLASLINYRNEKDTGHILTLEDPIEFIHSHKKSIVTQREIGVDTDNIHVGIKNALRQAPDVVLIGEIRDADVMQAALNISETGHLCFATMHAFDPLQAIERILSFFPSNKHKQIYLQLSIVLKAIITQRLVPTLHGGRTAAVGVLLDSSRVKDIILKGELTSLKDAIITGADAGMRSVDQHLFELHKAGMISKENALLYADSANDLQIKLTMKQDGSLDIDEEEPSGNKITIQKFV